MTLDEISLEDFRQILDVNILGAFLVSKVLYFCIVLLFYVHGKHLRSCRDG